ncbi:MAG: ABC transporter permease [Flavobacteriales bacterium]|nr:ABC transporter permease [Flavobacteriales bacterium]
MTIFFLRRAFYGLLVLAGVITVVFLLFNVLPGDPARMMLGQRADQASIDAINRDLGLDKPLSAQYIMYINDLMPLSLHETQNENHYLFLDPAKYDYIKLFSISQSKAMVLKYPYLRRSYQSKRKVSEIIIETLPETAVLAFASIILAAFLGIIGGIITAIYKNTWVDHLSLFLASLGMSGPSFYIGVIISWVFGYMLSEYTGLNAIGSLYTIDDYGDGEYLDLKNLILPAVALGIRPLAVVIQLMRNSLLEVLSSDYIRTANAKGLRFRTVIFKHALKNALNPVVTALSGMFASLLAGALFVEIIFSWKGVGWELYNALVKYDLPVVMGGVLITSTAFVVINVLVDISYAILDPRVRIR